ncbi:MAG: thiamine-phosphate kinase [Pseudomonadota bacterium]
MNEFAAIEKLFRPLSLGDVSARGLQDDIAYIEKLRLAITTDTLVEGTHFLPSDPMASVARKLVRVNLSDIIAKGCEPIGVFLNISWPRNTTEPQRSEFATALGEELSGIPLLGGDTTAIDGPMVASLMMLGKPHAKHPIFRNGAKAGDLLLVSGTIGDALIGLQALKSGVNEGKYEGAIAHYQMPNLPPIAISKLIAKYANASIDVSDGLLGDASKIAVFSNVGMEIEIDKIPLSADATNWIKQSKSDNPILELSSFGDDYQCLFTINPDHLEKLLAKAKKHGISLEVIGKCTKKLGLALTQNGEKINLPVKLSHEHEF